LELVEEVFEGPFATIFGNAVAKVIDQSLIVGNMEQTISTLAELTNLSYKTVLTAVKKLEELSLMKTTRKIGNAQAYKFEMNDLHELLECAQNMQIRRLKKEIDE
jgi:DNA-binding transcriptional regulator GbsR (MarR family)